jgi:hypothetical protein
MEGLVARLRYLLNDAEFVCDNPDEKLAVLLSTLRGLESLHARPFDDAE